MVYLLLWMLGGLVVRMLRMHLVVANDGGTPDAAVPLLVAEPAIAQAFYGLLDAEREVDYYAFEAEAGARLRPILLIVGVGYDQGLRGRMTLHGPGLPPDGFSPEPGQQRMTIMGREYVLTQSSNAELAGGRYLVAVWREAGRGAYAFCIGDREGSQTDGSMRARVDALLSIP